MSRNAQELQQKIHSAIPVSSKMGYEIIALSDTAIHTRAPLDLNINIHKTGFAGSLYSIAALTAWSICDHVISQQGLDATLVIAKASIDYSRPVATDIDCTCELVDDEVTRFINELRQCRRARLNLDVIINAGNAVLTVLMVATPEN